MRALFFLSYIFMVLSCDTTREEFLYDKDDPEYRFAQQLAQSDCIEEARIFDRLEVLGDFVESGRLNRIYKVSQDENRKETIYIKVISTSSSQTRFAVNSVTDVDYRKIIVFDEKDHSDLMSFIKSASCDTNYSNNFSASGLESEDTLTLTWKKETIIVKDSSDDVDDEPEAYKRETDVYKFDDDVPLFFYFYNGSKTTTQKAQNEEEGEPQKSNLSITDVTNEVECNPSADDFNNGCDFSSSTINNLDICEIEINLDAYLSNEAGEELFDNTNGCDFLDSGV